MRQQVRYRLGADPWPRLGPDQVVTGDGELVGGEQVGLEDRQAPERLAFRGGGEVG
jgi:hypothetical protein